MSLVRRWYCRRLARLHIQWHDSKQRREDRQCVRRGSDASPLFKLNMKIGKQAARAGVVPINDTKSPFVLLLYTHSMQKRPVTIRLEKHLSTLDSCAFCFL